MNKNTLFKIINPVLALLLINQVLMALLHDFLPKEVFEVFHEGGGIVFAILAAIHLFLNWNWVKTNFFRKS